MCNLFSQTKSQDYMRQLFDGIRDVTGNLPSQTEIYPDYTAPIVRTSDEGMELALARWGLPTPPQYLEGKKTDKGVTNVRNTASSHWRRWLGTPNRCLVPLSRFSEPDPVAGGRAVVWFELADECPAFFAGLWVSQWASVRKLKEGETTNDLFAFLTTEANAEVSSVHPKAMPVILTKPEEWDAWMTKPWADAKALQKPLADGSLRIANR